MQMYIQFLNLVILVCEQTIDQFLLSIIAKVFETVVHRQVTSYFISNNLFAKAQSGFRSGHSTQDVLLRVTEDWKLALDDDNLVGIMFIDLSKAFDSIDHSLLTYCETVCLWIR